MDLHVYRNSQDRWYDLRSAARDRGAVLAVNAVTLDELVERLTPDIKTATPGQRLAILGNVSTDASIPNITRYAYDAVNELKAARVRSSELRTADASLLADILDQYNDALRRAGLSDSHDRRALAASRAREARARQGEASRNESNDQWLLRFERVVLHALYDLTEVEFLLIRSIIEVLPEGGTVMLFNTTANVKPTQFAEWTWQRFIWDETLAEKTFPEFCRSSRATRPVLERLFVFGSPPSQDPLPADDSLQIVQASGRYNEVQTIGGDIADLLARGETPNDIAVVVRNIDMYGEMIEDVFTRYGIPHGFETGVPLLRIPFIKYWLALLDLAAGDRSRDALARVMSSAYFSPRLSPGVDVEHVLVSLGYIDRHHLRASALAARKNSPLTAELERFETFLDSLEGAADSIPGFLSRLQPAVPLTERDRQAWRVLVEELESVQPLPLGEAARQPAGWRAGEGLSFADFRKLASEICAIRTADRFISMRLAPGTPRVRIISPHSLGYREYKWIFAPGFADGEFPARSVGNPLLPDETVEAINASIRPRRLMSSRDRGRKEPLYLFMILDSAVNRVTITYPASTLEGNTIYPSMYVREIARHFERPSASLEASPYRARASLPLPRGEGEWLSAVASTWRGGLMTDDRARHLLGDDIIQRVRLESTGSGRANVRGSVLLPDHVWHPSELNALTACPFVFLARHVMRLRSSEVPDFEVPAMEIGILVHSILRDFYSEPVPADAEAARTRMNDIITRRLSPADINGQGPYSVFDPSLWKIRRQQVVSVLDEYVNFAVRDALDGFETQLEYLDAPLPASRLGEVLLSGRPDHVAVHRTGNVIDAIRVDDFKYSAASSSTARLLKESFQIPIYTYLAAHALGTEAARMEGRYLLLRSPGNPVVSYSIDGAVFDNVRSRISELMVKVQGGKFRPDPVEKQDCMDCEYRRLCRLHGS